MAGHSQFKNIMHRKGRQDAQKSKLFGKLAREITVSAKMGLPDPDMNARLRAAIIAARAENMPKDNIDRAIKKALGNDGEAYEQIRYEGYGPGGIAVIVEVLDRQPQPHGGRSAFGFHQERRQSRRDRRRLLHVRSCRRHRIRRQSRERRGDVRGGPRSRRRRCRVSDNGHEIYAAQDRFGSVAKALEGKFGEPRKATLVWRPQNTVAVDDEQGEKVIKLIDNLNEHDDVQNVYANFEVSDALVAKMSA